MEFRPISQGSPAPIKVVTKWHGKRRFTSLGKTGYEVTMDATEAWGGESLGNSPVEMLIMALTGCMGIDITLILEQMRLVVEGLEIEATGYRREEYPQAITEIHVTYHIDGDIPSSRIWRAIHMAEEKYCAVTASLQASVIPSVILNGEDAPQAE